MKVLIIDHVHQVLTEGLEKLGYEVDYLPACSRKDLLEIPDVYEGLVVRTKTEIDRDVLSHASKLKFIARAGAGLDNIDTAFCDERGIIYFNAGEANADAVGEQTVGTILALFAAIVKADKEVRQMLWDREGNRGTELRGRTVGIIGYGNTGKAVAQKLKGFGVRVLAFDKYVSGWQDEFAAEATREMIFEQADVLTLHVPLTEETHHMVNKDFLGRFRKNIWLMNLSRGKVVKLPDLVKAMEEGKVIGAGLDVLENEKLLTMNAEETAVFSYLRDSSRTVLTPHIGGWTEESYYKISAVLLQKIKELKNV